MEDAGRDAGRDSGRSSADRTALPLILLAAVIQGWVLYWLHHSIEFHHWPATDQAWLVPLYALALFIPVSTQLLSRYAQSAILWRFMLALAAAFFYFGWHFGAHVSSGLSGYPADPGWPLPLALLFGVLWLLVVPFAQSRLTTGHWASDYRSLFTHAWHNKLMLAEAVLFTGLFWLLLFLWQMLFHLLKIDFFRELFEEPIFIYPVTALTFGCAMHLIGSITQLTSVVLEQLLNVLKWLATIAAAILALFTVALVLNLPALLFAGQKVIDATWLLWLVAVMVLLLNAAYRDGTVVQPYPKWVARCLRAVVPLMVIIALTALYALIVRSRHYGLTVERVWAFVVAGAALLYSVGYSVAVFRKGAWLGAIAGVNVIVAVALIVIISAALTPLLSPFRLAANSQFRLVQERGLKAIESPEGERKRINSFGQNSPLHYLRFDAGKYGRAKLKELADSYTGADADAIRQSANAMLAQTTRYGSSERADVADVLKKLRVYPAGRTLDQALIDALMKDLGRPGGELSYLNLFPSGESTAGLFIDLNADKIDEFVLLTPYRGRVYEARLGKWVNVGDVLLDSHGVTRDLIDDLAKGNVSARPSKWSDLFIGTHKYRINTPE
jgi:Domain of unknown function (DUF4153)